GGPAAVLEEHRPDARGARMWEGKVVAVGNGKLMIEATGEDKGRLTFDITLRTKLLLGGGRAEQRTSGPGSRSASLPTGKREPQPSAWKSRRGGRAAKCRCARRRAAKCRSASPCPEPDSLPLPHGPGQQKTRGATTPAEEIAYVHRARRVGDHAL